MSTNVKVRPHSFSKYYLGDGLSKWLCCMLLLLLPIWVWIPYAYVQHHTHIAFFLPKLLVSIWVCIPYEYEPIFFINNAHEQWFFINSHMKWEWRARQNILIGNILYAFRIFYMSIEYSKWVRIFQMSMKRNLRGSQNHTHLEYSILIWNIPNAYGQAYLYRISEMSMNTTNVKKWKNLKNKKKW